MVNVHGGSFTMYTVKIMLERGSAWYEVTVTGTVGGLDDARVLSVTCDDPEAGFDGVLTREETFRAEWELCDSAADQKFIDASEGPEPWGYPVSP
jgi:hypothetical protein